MSKDTIESVFGILAFVLVIGATLAAATFLAINDHPWIALLVLLVGGSVRIRTGDAAKQPQQDPNQ